VNDSILFMSNVKRVNRFNVLLIWIISALLSIQAFLTSDASYGLSVLACTFSAAIIAALALLFNLKSRYRRIIYVYPKY